MGEQVRHPPRDDGDDPTRAYDRDEGGEVSSVPGDFRPHGIGAWAERWMYPGGRSNRLARLLNRGWAFLHATGLLPERYVTLEVPGRRTGRTLSFPLVMADLNHERYLVSMLGENSNWVRNVRAAGGRAVLRHGRRMSVRLEEVDPGARAPILRRYLALAPGPRAFIPVDPGAPVEEFDKVAPGIPVFRVIRRMNGGRRREERLATIEEGAGAFLHHWRIAITGGSRTPKGREPSTRSGASMTRGLRGEPECR